MSHPLALIAATIYWYVDACRVRMRYDCDLVATPWIGGAAPCTQDPPAADRRMPRALLTRHRSRRRNLKANFRGTLPPLKSAERACMAAPLQCRVGHILR